MPKVPPFHSSKESVHHDTAAAAPGSTGGVDDSVEPAGQAVSASPAPVRREPAEKGRVLKLHPDELVRLAPRLRRRGKAYSQDLRDRVISAEGVGCGQVAERYGVSPCYVVKARQRRDRLGEVTPWAQTSHTPPKLAQHYEAITAQVARQPDITLDELRASTKQTKRKLEGAQHG